MSINNLDQCTKQWVSSMSTFRRLWVDDKRPIPQDKAETGEWCSARSAWEALLKLEIIEFDEVSLDHDLASFVGNKEITGYDILSWLEERKEHGKYIPSIIHIHSANPVFYDKSVLLLKKISNG